MATARPMTVPTKKITRRVLDPGRAEFPDQHDRPMKRADCLNGVRPCPYVGCKYNLYLDVNPGTGSIKFNFPEIEPGEMIESCALDIATVGKGTLDEVGRSMNVSRERARQVEEKVLRKLEAKGALNEFNP